MGGDGDESVRDALSSELSELGNGATFTIVEFGMNGVTVWEVSRDAWGIPGRPHYTTLMEVPATGLDSFYLGRLEPLLGSRLLLVAITTTAYSAHLLKLLLDERPVPVHHCRTPLREHIRGVITTSPLRSWYELVVLRQARDGRLEMDLHQLFPPDASSGYNAEFTVRCAPTDQHGTAFAVVVRQPSADGIPTAPPRPHAVEIQSGILPPGTYDVTAWLVRPDHVEFHGLPVKLAPDTRKWQEIARSVPRQLTLRDAPHLVCMLEVSGGTDELDLRIERLESLIAAAEAGAPNLKVSLVTYGPHAVERNVREDAASVLAWATTSALALRTLRGVKGRETPKNEYARAAQAECALRAVAARLTRRDGRPALVTVGARPPHPPRVDLTTEIIPCNDRVSWHAELTRLRTALPELRFGALFGTDAVGEIWRELGRDAHGDVDVVDISSFATQLGLCEPAQAVPFPLIGQRGT
jgi:hypothetical protein